ncbi:MerR family transcriptional regulator [Acinetobacter shaoyimingii]|uniref:MerR family transcriptional regulator n=1 Tax=Acinetobacter shaoyimingii TaxID=2715164 RepID=A0A6G8RZZ2_9GAMM|nr:MerR family transcriptional regulator [Acinetobacter shaoyimingii]NHB59421.1 MerR family transcriptional regulator [Acinetobacter shaoyimingii]QIO07368.1 MerR family transcriptional regulator [Acinetobacter shaoyimingii]
MLISEVVKITGLSIHTLRYYEKEGLLKNIYRNQSGRREYDQRDLDWLIWIKRLKSTGMPLNQIKKFSSLRQQGNQTLNLRQQMLIEHSEVLKQEIQRMNDELNIVNYKIEFYEKKKLELE